MTGDYYNWWYPGGNVAFYFNGTRRDQSGWYWVTTTGAEFERGYTLTLQSYGPGQYYQSTAHDAYTNFCSYNGQNKFSAMCGVNGCVYPPPWNSWTSVTISRPTRPDYGAAGHPVYYLGPGIVSDHGYSNKTPLVAGNSNGAPETPQWVFAAGSQFGNLSCTTCLQPVFTATRRSTGCLSMDVVLNTSYNGFLSDPFYMFINAPWNTVAVTGNGGGWVDSYALLDGYLTYINYNTRDMCTNLMSNYEINESFGAWQVIAGSNWLHAGAGSTTVDATGHWWDTVDFVSGANFCSTLPCVPPPANPGQGPHTLAQWVPQSCLSAASWSGSGERIQTDTLQRYTDSAWHANITTPAPQ